MTIQESLILINSYTIPGAQIEKICVLRGLAFADEFTKVLGDSEAYKLATADTYFWLSFHPSIVEQEVGINNAKDIKDTMRAEANKIYVKYGDDKFDGSTYGMIGGNWND
jgi:hypothetical protein